MALSQPTIQDLLNDLLNEIQIETLIGKKKEIVESLAQWYEKNHSLTEAQEKMLRKIHREFMK